MRKDIIYAITCLSFAIIIGGAVYEHLTVVPKWTAGPPASLAMFQGEYGLKTEMFWMLVHPITVLLFVITLIIHWRSPRKTPLATVFAGYIAILIITSIYFVPELVTIINTSYAPTIDADLTRRAQLWETLSIVRLGVLIVMAITLFSGLTKDNQPAIGGIIHKTKARPATVTTLV